VVPHSLTKEQTRHVFDRWLKQAQTKGNMCPMGVGLSDAMETAINKVAREYPDVKQDSVFEAHKVLERELHS
jgi:hypothetical protein